MGSLLLFLTEKLPRTEEDVVQGTELPITMARRQIGEAIRQKMDKKNKGVSTKELVCEPFCGCLVCYPSEQVVGWKMGRETRAACLNSSKDKDKDRMTQAACLNSSLIEMNALHRTNNNQHRLGPILSNDQLAAAATEVTAAEEGSLSGNSGNDGLPGNLPTSLRQQNASTLPQNKTGTMQQDIGLVTSELESSKEENEFNSKSSLKQERDRLQGQVDSLKVKVSQIKAKSMTLASNRETRMSRKTTASARLAESRAGLEKHRKILGLLPEGEANLTRLLGIVEKSQGRLLGLKQQWEDHRGGLEKEHQELEEALTVAQRLAGKGKNRGQPSLEEQQEKVTKQLQDAGKEYKRLVRVVEVLRSGESREGHTQRILAIMRQLEKLQLGVDTVITDVKGVQKDINMLNGKLERSFFEICMAMKAKIRNKEPYVEHSMVLLRTLHEESYCMVELVRQVGSVGRETRELQETVRAEKAEQRESKAQLLSNDLKALQAENKNLAKSFQKSNKS